MKRIICFEHVDMGIREGMATPVDVMRKRTVGPYNGYIAGVGTDAESALDDMLHMMQEADYDITGLEGQIKDFWNPSQEEGDGKGCFYHFGITFRFEE